MFAPAGSSGDAEIMLQKVPPSYRGYATLGFGAIPLKLCHCAIVVNEGNVGH